MLAQQSMSMIRFRKLIQQKEKRAWFWDIMGVLPQVSKRHGVNVLSHHIYTHSPITNTMNLYSSCPLHLLASCVNNPSKSQQQRQIQHGIKVANRGISRCTVSQPQHTFLSHLTPKQSSLTHTTQQSPLLRLPAELRNQIFTLVLHHPQIDLFVSPTTAKGTTTTTLRASHPTRANCIGLLRTCRQTHAETSLLLYELNVFTIRATHATHLVAFLARRTAAQIDVMAEVQWKPALDVTGVHTCSAVEWLDMTAREIDQLERNRRQREIEDRHSSARARGRLYGYE